jgi:protocatechuate 3,4-dioxygenase beta subunit
MLKTYGLIFPDGRKEIASIVLDEEGNPRIDTIRPYPIPDGWVDPTIVPFVKIQKPATGKWEPKIVWFSDRVERQWTKP